VANVGWPAVEWPDATEVAGEVAAARPLNAGEAENFSMEKAVRGAWLMPQSQLE
jgi:hypothetical protein